MTTKQAVSSPVPSSGNRAKVQRKKRNNNNNKNKKKTNESASNHVRANQVTPGNCDKLVDSKIKNNPKQTRKQSNLITNYFPIVSRRLLNAKLKEEENNQRIIYCIKNKVDPEEYLSITEFEGKGKAIIAAASIKKGAFICEYSGDLIDLSKAKIREKNYEITNPGCYMYYFNWNSTTWCVDATEPTGRLGRLINHSRKAPNCKTKVFEFEHVPHLIFIALRDINPKEEILYDYGERDPNAIKSNRWLTTT